MKHPIRAVFLAIPLLCGSLCAQTALQSQEVKSVNGTADATVNVTLPPAPPAPPTFNLSGPITGTAAFFLGVTAQSTDGLSFYTGTVDFVTNNYLVKVPAGTYKLSVSYIASLTAASSVSTYNDPAPVPVTADTVHPIVVVPAITHVISGTVSALDSRFSSMSLFFYPTDVNAGFSFSTPKLNADGTYAGSLSDGAYAVFLALSTKSFSLSTSVSLGSVTVAGTDLVANFAVPALSSLSGVVQTADGTPVPKGSSVVGIEGDLSQLQKTTTFPLFSFGSGLIDNSSGAYQVILASSRQYLLGVSLGLFSEDLPQSAGEFTYLLPSNLQLAGDVTQNIALPQLPGTVIISGQVSDSTGAPVANATVEAGTAEVAGIATGLGYFSRGTQTDATGNYRLVVLSGTGYDLLFTPPIASISPLGQTNIRKSGSVEWIRKIHSAVPR